MIGSTSHRVLLAGLVLVGAALACTAPGQSGPQPTPLPTVAGVDPANTTVVTATQGVPAPTAVDNGPTQQPSGDPTASCPAATDGTTQFISKEYGFCFLYPSEMTGGPATAPGARQAAFQGPVVNPSAPSPISASFQVTYNGPADVADSAAYAQKWHDLFAPDEPAPTPLTLGSQPAALVSVPGQLVQQTAFVVAGGQKYTVTFPTPSQYEQLDPLIRKAWDTVTGSIVFFQPSDIPQVTRPEDVCPKAGADTKQMIDWAGGVCMLYPAAFELSQYSAGRGWFDGGPVLGQMPGGPVRADLAIAYFAPAEGKTPRQWFQDRLVNQEVSKIDVAGAKDTTISGQPAIVWTEGAPEGSRQAIIVSGGSVYTIVNQPYNDPNFPGGEDNVELVWNTVTQSLAFFTPWQ